MTLNAKNILLAGTALMAVSIAGAGTAQAQAQNIGSGAPVAIANTGTVTFTTADAVGTLVAGGTVSAANSIIAGTANHGTLRTLGAATISSTVGAGNAIGTIDINGANGTTAIFSNTVNAQNLTFTGGTTGAATFNGTTSTIANAIALNGRDLNVGAGLFTATAGITGGGKVTLDNTGSMTVNGGASTVTTVTKTGAGASTLSGDATTLTIGALNVQGGTLTISAANTDITGDVTITTTSTLEHAGTKIGGNVINTGGGGTLTLNGTTQLVSGTIGAAGPNKLGTLNLSGSGTKTLNGAVHTGTLNILAGVTSDGTGAITADTIAKTAGAGTAKIDNNVTVGTSLTVDGGILDMNGTTSTIGGTTTLSNNGHLQFAGASLLGVTGAGGSLTLDGTSQSVGAIGSSGNALTAVNLSGGTKTLGGAVYATTTNISNATTANAAASLNGNVVFKGDGTLALANNAGVTGTVTSDNQNEGTITFAGTTTMDGAIGANGTRLKQLSLNGAAPVTFGGAVYAQNLTMAAGSTANFGDGGAITNNVATVAGDTINVTGGTLNLEGAGSTLAGTTSVSNGATLGFAGTSIAAATGAGTLSLTGTGAQSVGTVGTAGTSMTALNIGGTGVKSFTGDIYATNLTFSAAGTANLTGATNVAAQAINFNNNAGTVTYGTGVTYTGTASSTGGANGTLQFGDNAAVNGTIGSAGNKIGNLTFAGGANTVGSALYATNLNVGSGTVTTSNTTLDTNVNFAQDGTLTVASGSTITGNVGATTDGQGTLVYTGPLTIGGNLNRIKSLAIANALTITGNGTAADSMNVGIQNVTVGGTFATTGNTLLTYLVNTPTTSGKITATGEATVVSGTRVNMIVDTNVYVNQGQEFVLIDGAESGGNVATLTAGNLTTTSTALLHFKQKTTDKNNLVVYADRTQMNIASTNPNNGAVGQMLDALAGGGNADVNALQIRLANLATATEVDAVLSTLIPDVSGAVVGAAMNVGGATSTIINNRIASLRSDGSETGMMAGDITENLHVWGQVFGAKADQNKRDRVAGYEADSYGTVFGVDSAVTETLRAGVAFSYANTDVDGDDANRTKSDIDSYQLSLYGDLDLPERTFLSGQIGYIYSDIDTARHTVGGLTGNTARADFNSNQYVARAELGRHFDALDRITLTPSALVNYNHIDISDYSEKGVGGLGLRNVDTERMDIFEVGVNLVAEATFDDTLGGSFKPNLHGGYRYDLIGDSVATTGRLAGGGAAFKTNGFDPAQSTVNVGTGLKWTTSSNFEFSANYDFEYKSDYDAHSGYVRAGYKF